MDLEYRVDTIELKKIMIEMRLEKISDLAKASGVDRNTLGKILSEELRPSTTAIEKIMRALSISPERFGAIFFSPNLRNM